MGIERRWARAMAGIETPGLGLQALGRRKCRPKGGSGQGDRELFKDAGRTLTACCRVVLPPRCHARTSSFERSHSTGRFCLAICLLVDMAVIASAARHELSMSDGLLTPPLSLFA